MDELHEMIKEFYGLDPRQLKDIFDLMGPMRWDNLQTNRERRLFTINSFRAVAAYLRRAGAFLAGLVCCAH